MLDQGAVAGLGLAHAALGPLSLGDVADEPRVERRLLANPRHRQLDGEPLTVGAHGFQLEPLPKDATLASLGQASERLTVSLPQGVGDDQVRQLAADDLFAPIAKGSLSGRIEAVHRAAAVDRDDAVECRVDDRGAGLDAQPQRVK